MAEAAIAQLTIGINLVLMLATFWAAWSSHRGLKRSPEILVYLRPSDRHFTVIEIVFANVGTAAARNIRVRSHLATDVKNLSNLRESNVWVPGLSAASQFTGLPAGKEIAVPLGISFELVSVPEIWPVTIVVDANDMDGHVLESRIFHLDPVELKELYKVGDSAINDIAKSIDDVAKTLKRGSLKVKAEIETAVASEAKRQKWIEAVKQEAESRGGSNVG